MPRSGTKFTRKLHVAFGVLLLITSWIAWYFFDSARWFALDAQKISISGQTLSAYQELATLTYAKLLEVTEAAERGSLAATDRLQDDSAVRDALVAIRVDLETAAALEEGGNADAKLELLADIERAVYDILDGAAAVGDSLARGDDAAARAALARMRSEGLQSRFGVLIEQAIEEQRSSVGRSSEQAVSLAAYIVRLLPVVIMVLVLITAWVVWRFSRSLQHSIGALREAVDEYSSGNLQHRIPGISERELDELGRAFNTMASQLAENREQLHDNNVRLEGMIEERTRALKESNEKLAKVDETRRQLLADISHEFRTPLTVIKGESEIALRGKRKTVAQYRESMERIVDTADYATSLVEDLLFIVRADAGEPRLEMQSVEITELVRGVCEEFRAKAERRDIEIVHEGGSERATLRGDKRRLRQVFSILLDNALRYSHEGGTIEIAVELGKDDVTVNVRDEGIGLTEEEARQAFQRFFRGRRATSHAQQGTGLGLPVARAIVDAHQGRITLTGKPGEGATATVKLPVEGSLRAVA